MARKAASEYDLAVSPQADPSAIRFRVDGADSVELTPQGDLPLTTSAGPVRWQRPASYQASRRVASRYKLAGDGRTISFEMGAYDRSKPLVIDPVLIFSTVAGGGDTEVGGALRSTLRAVLISAA